MPVTLSSLKRKVGRVTLFAEDGDENALHVEYYLVPLDTWDDAIKSDEVLKDADAETALRYRAGQLKNLVASWDFNDEETNQPIPLETDAICAKVPSGLIMDVLKAIAEDRDPNLRKSEAQS